MSGRLIPLGSVISIEMGQAPPGKACNKHGEGVPFVKAGEFGLSRPVIREWTTDPKKFAKKTDVLVCVVGATCGKINLGEDCAIGRSVAALRPHPDRIDQHYLHYFLHGTVERLRSGSQGSAQTVISKAMLTELEISLPPMEKQKRIVAVLDQAFAVLDRARALGEANLADAEELFGAAVDAVIHRLANGKERLLRLGSIVTRLTNGYVGPTRDIYLADGVPYLLARHVRDNELTFDGKTYVSAAFNEKNKKSKLMADDVLLVQSGHIGHSAVVPEKHAGHNCHAMIVLTTIKEVLSGGYLSAIFNTPQMQGRFQSIRTGSTVPHLTCGMVKELLLPVPPVEVQDVVLSEIRAITQQSASLKSKYVQNLADLAELRRSLLQRAFAG